MATDSKSAEVKLKPNTQEGSSKSNKSDSSFTKKKIAESSNKKPIDSRSKPTTPIRKTEVNAKASSSSSKTTTKTTSKTTTTTTTVQKRERKVYSLPGQKYDVPEEREPLRIFYESLSEQIPSSEMAEFWLMEHGMLSPERAKKAYEKKQRKQKQIRLGTPIKSPPPRAPSKPESSRRPSPQPLSKNGDAKAKKRIMDDSDDDDENFILSPKRRKA